MPTDATVAPKLCLGAFEMLGVLHSFICKIKKNGHGALVGLKLVKSTSVDTFL